MAEFRAEAVARQGTRSVAAAVAIVAIWIVAAASLAWWLWPEGLR